MDKKQIIIGVLDGKMLVKDACEKMNIHKETLKKEIIDLAKQDKQISKKFVEYSTRNSYANINFRALFREMLQEDRSQSEIAKKYGIPARTISRQIEKLSEVDQDKDIYDILKEHSLRYMSRIKDKKSLNKKQITDEKDYKYKVKEILSKFPKEDVISIIDEEEILKDQIKEINMKISKVEQLKESGKSWIEIKNIMKVDRSQYNRDKKKRDAMEIVYKEKYENDNKSMEKKTEEFRESIKYSVNKSEISKENKHNLESSTKGKRDAIQVDKEL